LSNECFANVPHASVSDVLRSFGESELTGPSVRPTMIVSIGATPFQIDLDDDRGDVVFLRLVAGKPQSVTITAVDARRIPCSYNLACSPVVVRPFPSGVCYQNAGNCRLRCLTTFFACRHGPACTPALRLQYPSRSLARVAANCRANCRHVPVSDSGKEGH